jgi:CMP-N,N'-diacetyllegionaminic acid synthase
MNVLCTICARGGSKGLRNKALKMIYGKPLIAYTVRQAIKSKIFTEVVVSTDSKIIQKLAKKYGAKSWFIRPKKLSNDKSAKLDAIRHAFIKSEEYFNKNFEMNIDLDITSPLRTIKDIRNSFAKFKRNKMCNNLISVCHSKKHPYFNMIENSKNGYKVIRKKKNLFRRQDAPEVFEINASIYIFRRNALLKKNKLLNKKTIIYLMPRERSADIDDIYDFNIVKLYMKKNEKLFK